MVEAISSLLWCGVLVYLIRTANVHIESYFGMHIAKQLSSTQNEDLQNQIKELRSDMNALRIDSGMKG